MYSNMVESQALLIGLELGVEYGVDAKIVKTDSQPLTMHNVHIVEGVTKRLEEKEI